MAALALVGNLATETVRVQWQWWPLMVWVATALLITAGVVVQRFSPNVLTVEAAVRALAEDVRKQWVDEVAARRVRQPRPLQVRWSSTTLPIGASRQVVLDQPGDDGWDDAPISGDVEQMVGAFRALPHRQLVVLGRPGAGKSVLAMLLTLGLVEDLRPEDPVPVLLPIASWNPTVERIDDFIRRGMIDNYSALGRHDADGISMAGRLLKAGRVLPVLDGLDELPAAWQPVAIEELDRLAVAGPLVLTCRSFEYELAASSSGAVLSRAAVVEIKPIGVAEMVNFLSEPLLARPRWSSVLQHLQEHPDGPLAQVLSTPLMVSIARAAYRNPRTDPGSLLTLPNRSAIHRTLFDAFLSSTYPISPDNRKPRTQQIAPAVRWLRYLAYQASQTKTRDWRWWQLRPGTLSTDPRRTRSRIAIATAATIAAVVGLVTMLFTTVGTGIWAATAVGVVVITESRFQPLWMAVLRPYRAVVGDTLRKQRISHIWVRLEFGAIGGMLTSFLPGTSDVATFAGISFGLVLLVMPTWVRPWRPQRITPRVTVVAVFRNATLSAIQYGIAGGLLVAIVTGLFATPSATLRAGLVAFLIYASVAAYGAGLKTWIWFRITHALAATQGHLPWRLWKFLNESYRRDVLRHAGTSMQFRHALLQDHLVTPLQMKHLRALADQGDASAASTLADLLVEQGELDEIRARADQGDPFATRSLVKLLVEYGGVDELRARANQRCHQAADALAGLLVDQGELGELRTLAASRNGGLVAPIRLADILAEHGEIDELRSIADDVGPSGRMQKLAAADRLADLLAEGKKIDELRARADRGDLFAGKRLADLLAQRGEAGELRMRVDRGDLSATDRLVDLLIERDEIDEALTILRTRTKHYPRSAATAAKRLVDLLIECDEVDEALTILRAYAAYPNREFHAASQLADLLARQGLIEELCHRADRGDQDAATRMALLLIEKGQVKRLLKFAHAHFGNEDMQIWSLNILAETLVGQNLLDEAHVVLSLLATSSDINIARLAIIRMAELHIQRNQVDEAIAIYRFYVGQDEFFDILLDQLLAQDHHND